MSSLISSRPKRSIYDTSLIAATETSLSISSERLGTVLNFLPVDLQAVIILRSASP